ncbi:ABC multidrug transporter [Histoplasma capsulatum var. duboisii H88]|uniref:ABC multidrug transporter n=1 Tax=Ajellomyces capsulatus (strain H88) TaxID=544711 RepID=F0U795_AJEC8|nr:ABC multidrug transporter [Histoplasma capsulatum var. duboisii H88]
MPPTVPVLSRVPTHGERARSATEHRNDSQPQVHPTQQDEQTLADLRRTLTEFSEGNHTQYAEPHSTLDKYLREHGVKIEAGEPLGRLGVCFKNLSTWGMRNEHAQVKTLAHAVWRTCTFQDVYEWTVKRWIAPPRLQDGRPLINDFSGVVRCGEIMLVLGRPGAGCSTFLRTIANHHSSFLGVTGSLDYSGLKPKDISKYFRGEVVYIPEEDNHFPTLTARQTLEFALETKTPKRLRHRISEMLEIYGRVFGISHAMDTLVGNEYICGISGGERKRLSIVESLATDSAVAAWDNSTRGLDAAAAVDYARSLRIMTDTCGKATIVTLYQASDAVYSFADRVMIIDEGRMLYQGPANKAKSYFENLGYKCHPRQTITDFLTGITSDRTRAFRDGYETRAPKGAVELEKAFKESEYFKIIQQDIQNYEAELCRMHQTCESNGLESFKAISRQKKSRFVSAKSVYNTSLVKQVTLCTKPELEDSVQGRDIISRQKRFAFVRPSAVAFARTLFDFVTVFVGAFFIFFLISYLHTVCHTAQFRLFASFSSFEVALRYCGVAFLMAITYGGYLLPLNQLTSRVPWVGWIAVGRPNYTTPALYAFEACMATEFHNLQLSCEPRSIIPSGPDYTNTLYQTCAGAGSLPGQLKIGGDAYLAEKYGFYYHNVWRDFGILILFIVVYTATNAWLCEAIEWDDGSAGAVSFNRKRKFPFSAAASDEENRALDADHKAPPVTTNVDIAGTPSEQIATTQSAFAWRNLTYTIRQGDSDRVLLNDVSGYCQPGTLTALVGSSGAGKSTLLTTLTQRQNTGTVTGDIMINGQTPDVSFRRKIGYCQQMDIHDKTSTIREAFEFSALLRQGADISRKEKLVYVDTILHILELTELQDAVIGSLPIEQKRRTTIGVELCAKPSHLLFLDEPTSGLDSEGAFSIVVLLRKLADAGLAILCTIHQASHQQIEIFDRVLALNPGGNVFYFGEVGPSGKAICDYYGRHGVFIEDEKNVADLLIEVGVGVCKVKGKQSDWNEIWKHSPEASKVQEEADIICSRKNGEHVIDQIRDKEEFASTTWEQIVELTKRTSRHYWRSPEYPYSRLYASAIHALLNGLTYLQIGNSETDMQSRAFSCFLILMLVPEFVNGTSMKFTENRDMWEEREYPSRIYGWISFTTAQILSELPYALAGGAIFYLLFYYAVGLPLGVPAGYTFLMVLFFHLFSTSWGQWIAAMSSDAVMAANLMPFFLIMCELFNGVLHPKEEMSVFWAYTMYYLAPFTYWIWGMLSMIMKGAKVTCTASELITFHAPPNQTCVQYAGSWISSATGYLANPDDMGNCQYCSYKYGDEYLAENNLSASKSWPYLSIFVGFMIANYFIVYLFVYVFSVKKLFKRSKS